jgi:YidC/Oxa1 family membrane protein insertase
MEKRILFAFLLSLAVLYGFRFLYPSKAPTPQQISQSAEQTPPASVPAAPVAPTPTAGEAKTTSAVPAGEIHASEATNVVIETPLYLATVSNHGAVLKSFKLKHFTDPGGNPIELIDATGAEKLGWPLAAATGDGDADKTLAGADFAVKREGARIDLEFAGAGIHARKVVTFDESKYGITVASSVQKEGKPLPHELLWQSGFGDQSIPPDPARHQVVYRTGGAFTKATISSLKEPREVTSDRAGVEDQYFLAMFLLPTNGVVKIQKQEYPGKDGKPVLVSSLAVPTGDQQIQLYVGPKEPNALISVDPGLMGVLDYDYGWFGFIAKPLTAALLWIHSYIGNFGWSIIVLTALINLVLFPLRLKQQVSMQKMQKIQPQMRTLQDKYKKLKANDPKRVEVQSQMMNLYKEHGINPMSGCLPLLLQMPFLIAFWKMLSVSIELRHAPWMFWVTDLSRPDPFYIMPILMAVSMFITQKMTPTTADPVQARMMMIMPIMFSVLFISAQSGLMLYWLTSNVVGIGQQFAINKYWSAKDTEAPKNKPGKKQESTG